MKTQKQNGAMHEVQSVVQKEEENSVVSVHAGARMDRWWVGNKELQKSAGCQTLTCRLCRKEARVKSVWGTGWSQMTWSTGPWVSMEEEETRQVREGGGAMVRKI